MDDLITDSRYSWTRLGLTLFVATVINAGMWVIIVIMPAIEAEYGGTRAMASLPYTLTMVGFALGNYVIGCPSSYKVGRQSGLSTGGSGSFV